MITKLLETIDSQQQFWEAIHNIIPKRKCTKNNITTEQWFNHFQGLLDKDGTLGHENDEKINFEDEMNNDDHILNRPISEEEVLYGFCKLKCNKAAGPDGMSGEFLKYAGHSVVTFFVRFLNALFDKGVYPQNWTESVILPLYKKGNVNDPGNYRGISLCDSSSKIYGAIINQRLQKWVEEHNLTGEYQAGFKKGYSTIDNLFTLISCIVKQFSKNRKLYVAFIDFEKCFDSINRNLLWPILIKNGVKGKMFRCVRSMYDSVKARVRSGANLTQRIQCSTGVKQGDVCSPILFSLFINELAVEIINRGRHGVTFSLDAFELFVMLLADDVVLVSETIIGLQTQLNSLQRAASSLSLKVNKNKSNIVVFRKGGYLGQRERWTYEGNIIEVVNACKYLGMFLSTKLSFVTTCRDSASKAKRALICVLRRLRAYDNYSLDIFLKIFDCQIQPIMQYGSEIWGLNKAAKYCENVHLYGMKKLLGVNKRTPNDLVYYELNRYPVTISFSVNCVRYWLKLIHMQYERLPKKAYLLMHDLDSKGKYAYNWVSQVRQFLFQHGFGEVWLSQGVGDIKVFLHVLKQRLIDCRWQICNTNFNDSERYSMFRTFAHSSHDVPMYLLLNINAHLKNIMTKFRFGVSDIATHHYRYRFSLPDDLRCPLCKNATENELHFVLCCPFFNNLRHDLIPLKFHRNPNAFRLSLLLASTQENTVKNLCVYLYKAFKARDIALS